MMKWYETVSRLGKDLGFMSIATTGVRSDDEVIGVSLDSVTASGDVTHSLVLRQVDGDRLLPGQEFHQITADRLRSDAVDDDAFKDELRRMVADRCVMTYNPDWMSRYMDSWLPDTEVHDASLLFKAIMSRLPVVSGSEESMADLMASAARAVGRPKPIRDVFSELMIEFTSPAQLPLESMSQGMLMAWEQLAQQDM